MSRKEKLFRMVVETIMPGPIYDTIKFISHKFRMIKSGNSFFELIVFVCSYFDVAAASYLIDHITHNLPVAFWIACGLMISAFVKITLLLLFDDKGVAE
jgi:hypothetical protein